MSERGSMREFAISSDVNCLEGLEGGVHHQKSEFDLLDLLMTFFYIVDTFGNLDKFASGPQLLLEFFSSLNLFLEELGIKLF